MEGKRVFKWFLFLFIRYALIYVGAWQLDILCANLLFPVRFEPFYFWFWELTKWDAYALFFWVYALGTFSPEIYFIVKCASLLRGIVKDAKNK